MVRALKRLLLALALTPGAAFAQEPAAGRAIVEAHCAACHTTEQVFAAKKSRADWATTIEMMVGFGAEIGPADREAILAYLATHNAP